MVDPKKPAGDAPGGTDAQLRSTRERLLPPLTATPRVVLDVAEIAGLDLSDGALRVIPYLDGVRTVNELLEIVSGDDNLFDVLDELVHEGVVELSRR
jgi:hypothetical protein